MVKRLEALFNNKIWSKAAGILFPFFLILFSMLHVGEGVTVTDTGYNYGNFVSFDVLDDMWKFSTYLAGMVGALFTKLPLGQTMIGLNIYTGLIKTAIALVAYFFCIHACKMRKEAVFVGEMVALGLCWCPTALTYNYLTYLLFSVGAMLLYLALIYDKKRFFVMAGIALGVNVFVRLPNLAEMALIAVVWLCGILYKKKLVKVVQETLFCVLGYVAGLGTVFAYIVCRYGLVRYTEGIKALFAMTDEAGSYTVKAMIVDMLKIYIRYFKWFAGAMLLVVAGMLLFKICEKKFVALKGFIFTGIALAGLYLYYKKGMFDFDYRGYDSIFALGVMLLTFCLVISAFWILFTKRQKEEKVLAAIVCVIILITPLGSNNHLYSPINNLFLAAPFLINYIWHLLSDKKSSIMLGKVSFSKLPYKITVVTFACVLLIQSILFGANFVFRDGLGGEARKFQVSNNPVLQGMYTTKENAQNLQELNDFINKEQLTGREVILFGNVPALAFYYELSPALSSTWPDLQSFSYAKFESEIDKLKAEEKTPVIMVSSKPSDVGEYDNATESLKKKWQCLGDFMESNMYQKVFTNDAFTIYIVQE